MLGLGPRLMRTGVCEALSSRIAIVTLQMLVERPDTDAPDRMTCAFDFPSLDDRKVTHVLTGHRGVREVLQPSGKLS